MWQLCHSQSSGHLSCGQFAAGHRNNILGHLNPFLACPGFLSHLQRTQAVFCLCLHTLLCPGDHWCLSPRLHQDSGHLCSWETWDSVCHWVLPCV